MCDPDTIKEEPIPGLPDDLPEGEDILWQGSPNWKALALHVFHVRAVAVYFVLALIWQVWSAMEAGAAFNLALADALNTPLMGLFALGVLGLLAWLMARSTIYTITNHRVVIRAGVALPKAVNIPFAQVGSASLKLRKSGNGDIPLQTTGEQTVWYLPIWPHVRPWKVFRAEPMLRGLDDAGATAELLAGALADYNNQPVQPLTLPETQAAADLPPHAAAASS